MPRRLRTNTRLAGLTLSAMVLLGCGDGGAELEALLEDLDPSATTEAPSAPLDSGGNMTAPEPTSTTAPSPTTPVQTKGGTRDLPFAFDTPTAIVFDSFGDADESVWNTTIGSPRDITAEVLAENQFNDPPPEGVVFAGFPAEMTLVAAGKEPLSVGFNLTWEVLGGATSTVYDAGTIDTEGFGCGVAPAEFDDFSEVYAGGTLAGTVCIPLPAEDLAHPDTQVSLTFFGDTRVIFGADGVSGTPATPAPDIGEPDPPAVRDGSREAPFAYDVAASVEFETFGDAEGSVWDVVIGAPNDITAVVLAENQFNDPPPAGVTFVGFPVAMTLVDTAEEPLSVGFNMTWEILGGASAGVYNAGTIKTAGFGCGVAPDAFDDFAEVLTGGTLTGTVCIPIPAEDLSHPGTQIAMKFISDTRTIFGP